MNSKKLFNQFACSSLMLPEHRKKLAQHYNASPGKEQKAPPRRAEEQQVHEQLPDEQFDEQQGEQQGEEQGEEQLPDEQQSQYWEYLLRQSLEEKTEIRVCFYSEGKLRRVHGRVAKIELSPAKIYLQAEKGIHCIEPGEVLSIEER